MKRILVVDDDDLMRGALRSLCEYHGYLVSEASDGKVALKIVRDDPPDLVITDIVMPDVEGIELISRLRRDRPALKIIAHTGSQLANLGNYLEIARLLGADRTFVKSYEMTEMLQAIRDLTQESEDGRDPPPRAV